MQLEHISNCGSGDHPNENIHRHLSRVYYGRRLASITVPGQGGCKEACGGTRRPSLCTDWRAMLWGSGGGGPEAGHFVSVMSVYSCPNSAEAITREVTYNNDLFSPGPGGSRLESKVLIQATLVLLSSRRRIFHACLLASGGCWQFLVSLGF